MNLKEKTVVIDNKTYRYSKIVMLSTNKKSVFKGQLVIGAGNYLFSSRESSNIGTLTAQHLYFLSTDKICEGDIGYINIGINGTIGTISYDKEYKTWDLTTKEGVHYPFSSNEYIKKVISSTDPSLNLSKPSDSFLQVYIDAYNKDEKIEKCLVEMERLYSYEAADEFDEVGFCGFRPKTTKGEITIRIK